MRTGRQSRDRVLVLSKSQILREGLKSIVAKVPKLHLSPVAAQVYPIQDLSKSQILREGPRCPSCI